MSREKLITRTVGFCKISAVFVDAVNRKMVDKDVDIIGKCDDEKDALSKLQEKKILVDGMIPVIVTKIENREELWGQTEENFVKNGKKLPPRTKAEDETDIS